MRDSTKIIFSPPTIWMPPAGILHEFIK